MQDFRNLKVRDHLADPHVSLRTLLKSQRNSMGDGGMDLFLI